MTYTYTYFDGKNIQHVDITKAPDDDELFWDAGGLVSGGGFGHTDPEKLVCALAKQHKWQRPHLYGIACDVAENQASRKRQDNRCAPCPICAEWLKERRELKESML